MALIGYLQKLTFLLEILSLQSGYALHRSEYEYWHPHSFIRKRSGRGGYKNRHYIVIYPNWLYTIFTDIVKLCTPIEGSFILPELWIVRDRQVKNPLNIAFYI